MPKPSGYFRPTPFENNLLFYAIGRFLVKTGVDICLDIIINEVYTFFAEMMSKKVHFARLPFRICPLAETHRFGHGCLSSKR